MAREASCLYFRPFAGLRAAIAFRQGEEFLTLKLGTSPTFSTMVETESQSALTFPQKNDQSDSKHYLDMEIAELRRIIRSYGKRSIATELSFALVGPGADLPLFSLNIYLMYQHMNRIMNLKLSEATTKSLVGLVGNLVSNFSGRNSMSAVFMFIPAFSWPFGKLAALNLLFSDTVASGEVYIYIIENLLRQKPREGVTDAEVLEAAYAIFSNLDEAQKLVGKAKRDSKLIEY
jgi:hypothetical protein